MTIIHQVSGQSAVVNSTLNEIKNFQISSLNTLSRAFNNLRDEVYGHFFRSQTTLRVARQSVYSVASKFPFYQLNDTMRTSLVSRLSSIVNDCMDPTISFLQIDSMSQYFNFMTDQKTLSEQAFASAAAQLQELTTLVQGINNDDCVRGLGLTARRLGTEYNPIITAITDCVRNATSLYRPPTNDFTRVHLVALPYINRMGTDLGNCGSNAVGNAGTNNQCIDRFLAKYCANDSCKTCSTM